MKKKTVVLNADASRMVLHKMSLNMGNAKNAIIKFVTCLGPFFRELQSKQHKFALFYSFERVLFAISIYTSDLQVE